MALGSFIFSRASGFGSLFAMVQDTAGAEGLGQLATADAMDHCTSDPMAPVPFAWMVGVFEGAGRLLGDPQFGARVGEALPPLKFGPYVSYAFAGATLREVIHRLISKGYLQSSGTRAELSEAGGAARMAMRYRPGLLAPPEHHAMHVLTLQRSAIAAYGPASEIALETVATAPRDARRLSDRLGAPVRHGAAAYAVTFPAAWLDRLSPLPGWLPHDAPEALAQYLGRPMPRGVADAVRAALALGPGAQLAEVARSLGRPARTLQYALARDGLSFRELHRLYRIQRAQHWLAETADPIAQIAFSSGSSDQAHFHRAFAALTGTTPARFRAATGPPR